jgi:hypothetical protein
VNWNAADPLNSVIEQTELLQHDDGFRAPDADPEAPYVTWDAEGMAADTQNIHFIHGALHLFDYGAELQKCCWERSGGIALIDQIRQALAEGKFPLFVAEGSSAGKLNRIRHSGYLQRSLKSFAAVCRGKSSALFIFGHSLADNDDHVIRKIEKGKLEKLYVSFYGARNSDNNQRLFAKLDGMATSRDERSPLDIAVFDSSGVRVWG